MTVEEEKIPVQNLFSSSMKTWRLFGFSAKSIFQEWRAPSQELLVHKRGRLKSWDASNRKSKKVTKLRHEVFESTEEDILIYIYIYKTSQIVAMFLKTQENPPRDHCSKWRSLKKSQIVRYLDRNLCECSFCCCPFSDFNFTVDRSFCCCPFSGNFWRI